MLIRFVLYGLLGWAIEIVWTALSSTVSGAQRGWRLAGTTYLWMFPIYGLLAPLYEPMHDALREKPWPVRGAAYGAGIMAIEYATGAALRKTFGAAPWDYTYARRHIHGLVRPDYFPYWAAVGLAMEKVHDTLTDR